MTPDQPSSPDEEPSDAPRVTVVLPVRDEAAWVVEQLDALAGQSTSVPWEGVVADNGSTDATRAIVVAHAIGDLVPVRIVDASRAPGVNVARNEGARAARGDLLVFCDGDDRVAPGWLEAYVRSVGARRVVAAGPVEVDALNSSRRARWGPWLHRPVEPVPGVAAGWGANMALPRSVWEQLGGFDESLRQGFDEIELFLRAGRAGVGFAWVEDARVDYRLPASAAHYAAKAIAAGRGEQRARRSGSDPAFAPLGLAGCARHLLAAVGDLARPSRTGPGAARQVLYASGQLIEAVGPARRRLVRVWGGRRAEGEPGGR